MKILGLLGLVLSGTSGTELLPLSGTLSGTAESSSIGKNVLSSLDIMWKGCLAIFIVIGIIIILTMVLNKTVQSVRAKKEKELEAQNQADEKEDNGK